MHWRRHDPQKLLALIAERQMTVSDFYLAAGFSRSYAYAILADPPRRELSDTNAKHVAQALGCTVEDFTVPTTGPTHDPARCLACRLQPRTATPTTQGAP
jgi:hypothetical protein